MERDAALLLAEEQAAPSDVDTDDEAHDAHEYDSWQLRELSRVTRDREERDKSFRDKEEMQRLRSMTEEEREEWDRTHPPDMTAEQRAAEKQKWSFMQKYYHKGAFFQSAADDRFGTTGSFDIYARDFGAATGEDKGFDRTMLPKVRRLARTLRLFGECVDSVLRLPQAMQVRKGTFGRAGQVKWTHLAAEDTSRKDDIWAAQKRACLSAFAPPLNGSTDPVSVSRREPADGRQRAADQAASPGSVSWLILAILSWFQGFQAMTPQRQSWRRPSSSCDCHHALLPDDAGHRLRADSRAALRAEPGGGGSAAPVQRRAQLPAAAGTRHARTRTRTRTRSVAFRCRALSLARA